MLALSTLSDDQLLALTLDRDPRAFEELVARYRGLVYRCILRVTGRYARVLSSECVDDIYAESCVLLWAHDLRRLRAYDPARGMKLASWLGLLAGHAAYDHLRRLSRRPPHDVLDDLDDVPRSAEPDALTTLLGDERRGVLRRLARALSPRDREFVSLYFEGDAEPEEVARTLGISVATVYSKKNKITARLMAAA
ncbi:MAG: sigma-70 family RNA polymerase sigma factor [Polyangia bacterium]